MAKISFILPMYKAEQYLPRVIDSLKKQTMADFEAIFVDDGSPDQCSAVCEQLFDGDPRFILIKKENGGVSSARNAGLDRACGTYIFFLDPDDCIEYDTAQVLTETAENADADMIIFGRYNDYYIGDTLEKSEVSAPTLEGVFEDHPCQRYFDRIATSHFVTDKLFRRDLIEQYHLRFKNVNIGEDGLFFAEYYRQDPKRVIFMKRPFYHYTIDQSASLSVSYHKERETDNFYLSNAIKETVMLWNLMDSPMHLITVKYSVVRDLQMGIKNISLSQKAYKDRYLWLKKVTRDKWVRTAVWDTPISMANSRNDKIKLLLLKMHMYGTVVYISGLNQRG